MRRSRPVAEPYLLVCVPVGLLVLLAALAACGDHSIGATQEAGAPHAAARKHKVLGQERIIAFTYLREDPKQLRSLTFCAPTSPTDWQYWRGRGVTPAVGQTWFALLNPPADVSKAAAHLANLDYGGDPNPVVCIDEFGFDFGGETDQKSAQILEEAKHRKPELCLTVWQMRGPIPEALARAYRKVVDLVLLEAYVGDQANYWWIATQVWAARRHGLLRKTIVALALGTGGNPGERWATTNEELEQQLRFVRLVAPESPGVGFFAPGASPELLARADELCGHFFEIPADGSGLPAELIELHKTFSQRQAQATLVCSPLWVEPNRSKADPNVLVEPKTMRVCLLNLGNQDAKDVQASLANPVEAGGQVFAEGVAGVVPARSQAVAVLPVRGEWKVWKTWRLAVRAPRCEVLLFDWR